MSKSFICPVLFVMLAGCVTKGPEYTNLNASQSNIFPLTSDHRVAEITGLQGPEAVRYDQAMDVFFVANFVGSSREMDSNGFIIRVDAETGMIDDKFISGTSEFPLHAPRGMFVNGDTLWVADAEGVHGFSKSSGRQLAFINLTSYKPGFLNDVASDGHGSNFVTDTGGERIYQFHSNGQHSEAASGIGNPNGITYNANSGSFLIAPWTAGDVIRAWWPRLDSIAVLTAPPGSSVDGIEIHDNQLIYAMQSDSTIRVYSNGESIGVIRTPGKPADIAIDTKRNRVAVPYIALDRVDIWQLPD